MNKILIVDDEESICEILQFNLEVEGFEADIAYSAEEALQMDLQGYSLILLDVMMGGMSGFKMAQALKKSPATAGIPIIFCTAKDAEDDKVAGLTLGADDYISKPFSVREVIARVKSVLRRTSASSAAQAGSQAAHGGSAQHAQAVNLQAPAVNGYSSAGVSYSLSDRDCLVYEGLKLDLIKHTCYVDGEEVYLTKKELEIMVLFLSNVGRVLSREEILRLVWSDEVVVLDRTIDVNIVRLRKKIGRYGKFIVTRQGYGYGFGV